MTLVADGAAEPGVERREVGGGNRGGRWEWRWEVGMEVGGGNGGGKGEMDFFEMD